MVNKRGNLGRGLSALLGTQAVEFANVNPAETVQEIPVENVRPNRYRIRQTLNNESMKELAESIRSYGILQPIIVRSVGGGKYELIAGERRLSAARFERFGRGGNLRKFNERIFLYAGNFSRKNRAQSFTYRKFNEAFKTFAASQRLDF